MINAPRSEIDRKPPYSICRNRNILDQGKKKSNYVLQYHLAKTWKQPKCPSTDEWIKKMWHLYISGILAIKKNEIMPFAAIWIELEIIT